MKNRFLFYGLGELKERNWTQSMLSKFLPEDPDFTCRNPHYNSAPQMRFYLKCKIELIESQEYFYQYVLKHKKKKEISKISAQKAVKTKERKLINQIEDIDIEILILNKNELTKKSIENYNLFERRVGPEISEKTQNFNFNRLYVNFLRHNCTEYDYYLSCLSGLIGKDIAYKVLKNKILDVIIDNYPFLKYECILQKK